MKVLVFAAALALVSATAFADHHEEEAKKTKHDKEHAHVTEKADHEHDEKHHVEHDHKAHHPEHKEEEAVTKKKK